MKGYYIHGAYMGWVGDHYQQFETEEEYYAIMREE